MGTASRCKIYFFSRTLNPVHRARVTNVVWPMAAAALPLKLDAHDQDFGLAGKARSVLKSLCGLRLRVVGVACQVNERVFISEPCILFVTELGYISNHENLRTTNSRQVSKNVDSPRAQQLHQRHSTAPCLSIRVSTPFRNLSLCLDILFIFDLNGGDIFVGWETVLLV